MRAFHSYCPADGHGLAHDPLNAIIAPRPIGWIGTMSAAGVPNLAPYSFFNLFAYRPPIIGFSSSGEKDSLANARKTRVFSWNLVTRALADRMNATAAEVARDVDEFALAGLQSLSGMEIDAPRVAESPVQFECRVTDIHVLRTLNGDASSNTMVFGEVVRVHIDPAYIVDGVYQTAAPVPVLRGGGPGDYFAIHEDAHFQMARPR